jgi:hypothetical protein
MPMNPWITNSFVDSCAVDPKFHPEDQAATELFRLHQTKGLGIRLAHSNQKEIDHPNTPSWVKKKAAGLVYTNKVPLRPDERSRLRKIHVVLTGNGKPENVEDDARHIFEAQKYGPYFVTTDERLLRRADEIRAECGVEILRPSKFLGFVHSQERPNWR